MSKRRNAHFDRRQRGFTLAEILVTTAIFAIIMIAALAVYDRSNQVFKTSTEAADMQQSTRIGFDKLVTDIRMAGFDYSRGGVPQNSWEAVQPDEQIEYAGPAAVVFRANFNYNTATGTCAAVSPTAPSCGNGLEPAYTPLNTNGQSIFPYVSTSNDEIVAYVLRSNNATANSGSISFWVDDYKPREVFPSSITPAPAGSNPSRNEEQVVINGIDTTNNNPPYTLYRVSVSDVHNSSLGTPVAENIRSMNFQYYTDATGTTLLTNPDGSAITAGRNAGGGTFSTSNSGAIGGDGQYTNTNLGSTTNFADRNQRALIQSVRVNLVGMNASPDLQGYTNPTETIGAIKSYRQYALSSLIVPRNLGKTGFPEPAYNAPGPPTITGACIGHCGAPILYWSPPSTGGPVTQYRIEWDSVQTGAFGNGVNIPDASATSSVLPDDGVFDVSQVRYYHIIAMNDNGPSQPSQPYAVTPQNKTKPNPVGNLTASIGQTNQITLNWTTPTNNANGFNTLACSGIGGSTDGSIIPSQETLRYKVYRGISPDFDPTSSNPAVDKGVVVMDFFDSNPPQPPPSTPGGPVTWVDSAAIGSGSHFPPANCKTYYYRVQVADRCARQNSYNVSNNLNDSISDYFPPLAQQAIAGSSTSRVVPNAPASLTIDRTTPNATGCPDPQNPSSPNCRITLNWTKVTADTAGNAIAVDTYRITRSYRLQSVGGAYQPDPLFGPNGQLNVSCSSGTCTNTSYTQQAGGIVGYVDTPPMTQNSNTGNDTVEYQYTVAALGCNGAQSVPTPQPNDPYSAESNAVQYPGCSLNPAIVEADAQSGATSTGGNTPLAPWVMNSGDSITVTPGSGTTLTSVQFVTTVYPQGTVVGGLSSLIPAPGPYSLTWSDQIDGQIYMVKITVTDDTGCQETHVKYVQDQQGAPCSFLNQTLPATCPTCLAIPNSNNANTLDTYSLSLTITNNGTDPMQLAGRNVNLTWALPVGDTLHTDLKLVSLVWTVPSGGSGITLNVSPQQALASPGPTVSTVVVPPAVGNLAVGASMTLQIRWQYLKADDCPSHNCPSPTVANELIIPPLQKLCMDYEILSEPGITKHCNVVGQSATTANPNSCD